MAATDLSPNVDNYYIGKGVMYFRPRNPDGTYGPWRDLGNVPEFEFTSSTEKLDHFSSRTGVRTKDLSVIVEKNATCRIVLEEWTGPNLAMYLLGTQTGADETASIDIGTNSEIRGQIAFDGQNDIGPTWNLWFPEVSFTPSGSLSPIQDEWGSMELTGDVSVVDNRFGIASRADIAAAELPAWGYTPPV